MQIATCPPQLPTYDLQGLTELELQVIERALEDDEIGNLTNSFSAQNASQRLWQQISDFMEARGIPVLDRRR